MIIQAKDLVRLPGGEVMTLAEAFDKKLVKPVHQRRQFGKKNVYIAAVVGTDYAYEISFYLFKSRSEQEMRHDTHIYGS